MDDTGKISENQQPKPIYESVAVSDNEAQSIPTEIPMQPEEVAPNVEVPNESIAPTSPELIPEQPPPVYVENKSKYMIIVGAVVFFIAVFILIFSMLNRGKAVVGNVTLTYWGLWDEAQIYQPLIAAYHAKHPNITINYEKMDPQQYREKLLARSKNGEGPDIFNFHNTWLPEIKDVVAPLPQSIMSNAEFEKTFYPIHAKDLKIGSYYYGIPLTLDGLVLIYNDNLLKKAGIAQAPSNWDDLINDVGQLSAKDSSGNIITSGIALGTANNIEHFSDILALMLVQNGADITKLDQPEAAQALQAYRKFAEQPNDYWNENQPNNIQAFVQERVAMIFAPSWEVLSIKAANPDLAVKVAPIPTVPGAKPVSIASYWVDGVSRYSKQQTEAWNFVVYLSQKESESQIYANQAKSRAFGTPVSRVDLGTTMMQNEYIAPVIKQADAYVSVPMISRTYDNGLNDQIVKYMENAVNATIQGTSYKEALQVAKQGIDQVMGQFQ